MHAIWNNKNPSVSREQVDGDMSRFERHGHVLPKQTGNHHQEHVYFVARNPYTRILSLYLQKVVNHACVHQYWSKGMYQPRADGRECMPANKTWFPYFVRHVAKKSKGKGFRACVVTMFICVNNKYLPACLAPTLAAAREVTILRLEEATVVLVSVSCQRNYSNISVLVETWNKFSASSCYYPSTGTCHDCMLKCIDPASNLTKLAEQAMSMQRVHPTSCFNTILPNRPILCLVSTIHKIFKFWDIHCGIGGN
jgi:hypothetical protein